MTIPFLLKNLVRQLPAVKQFYIAYSGGLDSHVLLHQLRQEINFFPGIDLVAVHVNHQLNVNAHHWQQHCEQICRQLSIPLKTVTLKLQPQSGDSLEEVARDERYSALNQFISTNACLLTAHHQDDQAETLLLQLFRGAGPKGLAGMPQLTSFGKGYHARPLLTISRDELLTYTRTHKLKWIEDDSNQNSSFDRNYLRRYIIPVIKQRWPSVTKCISRSARLCAQTEHILTDVIKTELNGLLNDDNTLSLNKLRQHDFLRQTQIIRQWLKKLDITLPSEKKLMQVIDTVIYAREDANPRVTWRGAEIRRYRDRLYIFKNNEMPQENGFIEWDLTQPVILPADGRQLRAKKSKGKHLVVSALSKLTIRFNVKGLRCKLPERSGTKLVNKLFQEWGVPIWERSRIPLLFDQDQLVSIVGHAVCEPFATKEDELGWELILS